MKKISNLVETKKIEDNIRKTGVEDHVVIEMEREEGENKSVSTSGHIYIVKNYKKKKDDTSPNHIAEIVEYRGYEVAINIDFPGQQFYCVIDGEEYSFGAYNTYYIDDLCSIIDNKLDVIYSFKDKYFGCRLAWFENDYERDIGLYYRNRLVKVFPAGRDYKLSEERKQNIIEESKLILNKFVKE